jgi:hypothetical protein
MFNKIHCLVENWIQIPSESLNAITNIMHIIIKSCQEYNSRILDNKQSNNWGKTINDISFVGE